MQVRQYIHTICSPRAENFQFSNFVYSILYLHLVFEQDLQKYREEINRYLALRKMSTQGSIKQFYEGENPKEKRFNSAFKIFMRNQQNFQDFLNLPTSTRLSSNTLQANQKLPKLKKNLMLDKLSKNKENIRNNCFPPQELFK